MYLNFKTIAQIFINPPTAKIKVTNRTANQLVIINSTTASKMH